MEVQQMMKRSGESFYRTGNEKEKLFYFLLTLLHDDVFEKRKRTVKNSRRAQVKPYGRP